MRTRHAFKRFTQTCLAVALAAGFGSAQALPTGQNIVGGSATISAPSASGLNIMSTAPRTVITWTGFDVAANESVGFNQNPLATGGTTHILNIINPGVASNIQGAVTAGTSGVNVYFINPNGFVLNTPAAGTAVGNAAATGVASTLNFSNTAVTSSQFMAGATPSSQITIDPGMPISSMSGINVPVAATTPVGGNTGTGGGGTTTPPVTTNPFSTTMTPAEFIAALQANIGSVSATSLTAAGLDAFLQALNTNGCYTNPANAACSAAISSLLAYLSDPNNLATLLAGSTVTLANNPTLGPLLGAAPGLSSYLAGFNAAQNAAFNQLQTYLNQNPGYAQYAANAIAQAAPQAVAQSRVAMSQALQQIQTSGAPAQTIAVAQGMLGAAPGIINNVLTGAAQPLSSGGVPGLQNFLFGNTLRATISNGVVNLGI